MKLFISLLLLTTALFANITLPQNFNTNFVQTITNDKGNIIKYNGSVIFKNMTFTMLNDTGTQEPYSQSLFKWSYTAPTKKEVCTDGIQLIVVDHDLEQVSNYLVDEGINLEKILTVAKQISTTAYQATYKDVEYLITLNKEQQLQQIVYVDNLDNGVKIIFSNMNYNNNSFDDKQLECNAPSDYDIIKG